MDSKRIDELLNKYWECETTLEEEQKLQEYFNGDHVADEHRSTAPLFRFYRENKKKSIADAAFEQEVFRHVKSKDKGKVIALFRNSMRIAAGIAVLMIAVYFIKTEVRKSTPQEIVDTYDDPQLAFEETKKALMMISKGFGHAEEGAKKINLFNEAKEEIQRPDSDATEL
jgi:hypothetical protein